MVNLRNNSFIQFPGEQCTFWCFFQRTKFFYFQLKIIFFFKSFAPAKHSYSLTSGKYISGYFFKIDFCTILCVFVSSFKIVLFALPCVQSSPPASARHCIQFPRPQTPHQSPNTPSPVVKELKRYFFLKSDLGKKRKRMEWGEG